MFLVLARPVRLKGQGVHQIHDRVGWYLIEYVLYHAVRVFADPGVYFTAGGVVELPRENVRPRKGRAPGQEVLVRLKCTVVAEPDGVGHLGLRAVNGSHVRRERQAHGLRIHAEGILHLCKRLAARPGLRHGHRCQHAHRRDERIPAVIGLIEQLRRELRDRLRRIRSISRPRGRHALQQARIRAPAARQAEQQGQGQEQRQFLHSLRLPSIVFFRRRCSQKVPFLFKKCPWNGGRYRIRIT